MRSNGGHGHGSPSSLFVVCLSTVKPINCRLALAAPSRLWLHAANFDPPSITTFGIVLKRESSSGCQCLCRYIHSIHRIHSIHSRYTVCGMHACDTPLPHVKWPCESHSRRHGSRAFDPRMGCCWLLLAIAAGIVRQKERAREAAGSVWASSREVLGNVEAGSGLSAGVRVCLHWPVASARLRDAPVLLRGPPCNTSCIIPPVQQVYIPLLIRLISIQRETSSMVADIQHERVSILVPVQAFSRINVMHHKRPCGQTCVPKPVALAMPCSHG